jgi:hypothetical protein
LVWVYRRIHNIYDRTTHDTIYGNE